MLRARFRRLTNCLRVIAKDCLRVVTNFREDFVDEKKDVDSTRFFISSSSFSFSKEFTAEISCYTNVKTRKHLKEAEYKKAYRSFQNIENVLQNLQSFSLNFQRLFLSNFFSAQSNKIFDSTNSRLDAREVTNNRESITSLDRLDDSDIVDRIDQSGRWVGIGTRLLSQFLDAFPNQTIR